MADDSHPMADARDALDSRLLAERSYDELFGAYYRVVVQRGLARRLSEADAHDVAQEVFLRIHRELRAGRAYPVPFRVVVHQVFRWTLADLFGRRSTDQPYDDIRATAPDPFVDLLDRDQLERLFARLPPREGRVCALHFIEGHGIQQVARELQMTRNAVDQALHRAKGKLRGWLGG